MTSELSEPGRQALKAEKQAFTLAVACMIVTVVGYGGARLLAEWKTRQLKAAGLWPRHYSEPRSVGIVGLLIALGAGLAAMVFFISWLLAVRDRSALGPVLPPAPVELKE